MNEMITYLISLFDRTYQRVVNPHLCFQLQFDNSIFSYNNIIQGVDGSTSRSLGNSWYILIT